MRRADAPRGEGVPVLVIEDEAAIVELLTAVMADLPAEVMPARSAEEALARLPPAGPRPALITLDLVLGDTDGLTVLAAIRARPELHDVPVLIISAQTDPSSQKRAYAAGASDFVAKPFSIELLDAKLRAWLRLGRLAAQPRLLRELCHEARSPLLAIGAAAQVLRRPDADEALRQRLSRAIEEEAERLARMLADLDGAAAAAAGPADARATLLAIAGFNVAAGDRGRLTLRLGEGELPRPAAHPDGLRQMLLNLIDNALAATARGGEVVVEARAEAGGVAISVRDSGPGIAAADLPRIFEDGFTTRGGAARGLGLGITQRLCAAAGGRLHLEPTPGGGATFTLWLPPAA